MCMQLQNYLQSKRGVRRALLITSAKSLYYLQPPVQRPISSYSCLASEIIHARQGDITCAVRKKDRNSKMYCVDCQQIICDEHCVNICLQCRK